MIKVSKIKSNDVEYLVFNKLRDIVQYLYENPGVRIDEDNKNLIAVEAIFKHDDKTLALYFNYTKAVYYCQDISKQAEILGEGKVNAASLFKPNSEETEVGISLSDRGFKLFPKWKIVTYEDEEGVHFLPI